MAFVDTKCGACNTEGLLTVNKDCPMGTWLVILKYKSRKDDINWKCKDEAEADECIAEIKKVLAIYNTPLGGPKLG